MDFPLRSQETYSIEYAWDGIGKASFKSSFLPMTSQELKVPFLEKWGLLPQAFTDTFINSMVARYEACIAIHSGHTPYNTDFSRGKCFMSDP
ncbi:hypothetical protein TNCV_384061 [Trichonephila clavipes]|nr:hypothetical protein TNCV_384061 [Trichonephila clavipes]